MKQQEHLQMQRVNLITEPLKKPVIQTKMKKPGKRKNPIGLSICRRNDHSYSTVPPAIPITEDVIKSNKPSVKCKILPESPFMSRKRRRKKNCITNSVTPEPTNNKLITEEVPLENRIVVMNSKKESLQKTVSLSMERKVHPTTVTISESLSGVQKILGIQKSICSVESQSVEENTSVYKPVAVTLSSTSTTDNRDTQTFKLISLSENSAMNLTDKNDSTTLNNSAELDLNNVKPTNVLDINNSNEIALPLLIYSNPKQPLYRLELVDSCENSIGLSSQQLNHSVQTVSATTTNCQLINSGTIPALYKPILNGYHLYSFPYKPEGISVPIKTGVRYTAIRCNTNELRPREIKIAPKTSNETEVSGNNTNLQYVKPLSSGTNTQSANNVTIQPKNSKKILGSFGPLAPISSLPPMNSNKVPCPPLLPLAKEIRPRAPVTKPVQEYPEIKIIDVRTDIVNKQDISDIPSSTDDIVQIQSQKIEIVGTPKNTNDVQIQSPKMDKVNEDSNPSQVQYNIDVESSISELIDQELKVFQVEIQVPQTMSETTQQQEKSNPCLTEQDKVMQSAMKNMSNAIAARQIIKHNKAVSEKRKLMLLEKAAMQKRRIDMLQHVFKVLNHCARMCVKEDFEIWFKKDQPSPEEKEDLKDIEKKQEVTHYVTERPGEWVDLLKVLKVRPINDDETPKRRRSSRTVTRPKSNSKRPKVTPDGCAQKRKSNLDKDAAVVDLPGTSSKIRKFKPNDSVMDESSSSMVSFKDYSENLELPTTEVQEVHFTTRHDQTLNEDQLEDDRETLKTDKSDDAQTADVMVLRQNKKARRLGNSETEKKDETPTHVRKKLGRSCKWITDSSKKGESEFIITDDATVKSESIEIKPDVKNYDTWNDEMFCQDFGVQECYVRLRRIEDLYPSGYSCIDFDAIFS